jgi:chromosome segregation protein
VLNEGLGERERRREQIGELLIERQQEIEAWTGQIADLEREESAQRANSARIAETFSVAQEQVEKIRVELVEVERAIGSLEAAQSALRQESDSAHEDLSTHEVRLAETRQRGVFLSEDVSREFQVDVASVDWKQMLWHADGEPEGMKLLDLEEEEEPDPAPRRPRKKRAESPAEADLAALEATDWDAVKAEVDALRLRMGGMGAVNLVAIEEYSELRQRHDFLKNQSDDLTRARAELIAAIDEINLTSQKQFEVTFEQIRKNFEYTFQTLFGGGRADIELVAAEDILESGIEIVAQPPGTKLKGISLLSGGQRTLTAVALLFALYLVKPSPFCLLDELDAPLDESNIGRFTDLLKKFVKDSQFIIITHNKRTVAAANAIYGVTMEERGVSKTVSMRFNHEHGEPEAHQPAPLSEAVAGAVPLSPDPVATGA